jgi:hypothetical protein
MACLIVTGVAVAHDAGFADRGSVGGVLRLGSVPPAK